MALAEQIYYKEGDSVSIQDIFERVSFIIPIEQRKFLDYFADTVAELEAMYSDFVFDISVDSGEIYAKRMRW